MIVRRAALADVPPSCRSSHLEGHHQHRAGARGATRTLAGIVVVAILAAACDRRTPIASCDDRLDGVYVVEDRRWMVLDNRGSVRTLEAFPLFSDVPVTPGLEVAPRVIDLDASLGGHVRRRFMRGAASCTAKATAKLTACQGDRLDFVVGDPVAPTQFEPCTFGRPAPTRVERWQRQR